jgi:hypothetical protein
MEPETTELANDPARDALASALLDALAHPAGAAPALSVSVSSFTRARKRLGRLPEEVVVELKTLIARAIEARTSASRSAEPAGALTEGAVRVAIRTYFEDL